MIKIFKQFCESFDGNLIKKITEHIGAEIDCDVHLRELPERDFVDIKKAFDEYSVLVFRGQPLLDRDQINFLNDLVPWKLRLILIPKAAEPL